MKNQKYKTLLILLSVNVIGFAQEVERPPVWGIAKMTFTIGSEEAAEKYYGTFLGFEKAFEYEVSAGKVLSYKVNDRQFLEFVPKHDPATHNRLVKLSFDCDEIEQMYAYLEQQGVHIILAPHIDEAGNRVLVAEGPEDYQVEFIRYLSGSLHKESKGRYLSERRISGRLHHAGLYVSNMETNNHFYRDVLGVKEMWRFKEENNVKPNYIYLHLPDCVENIEYIVTDDPLSSHPCFLLDDFQESIYTLKERADGETIGKPMIGKGRRWLLNMTNDEGLRVEFTETHTVR